MPLTVTQRPARWAPVINPVIYKITIKNFTFASITDVGGFKRYNTVSPDPTSFVNNGDVIAVITTAGVLSLEVVSASSASTITTTTAFISSFSGYINLTNRTGNRLEVEVFRASDNTSITDGVTYTFSPDAYGVCTIDISSAFKPVLSREWENETVNETDEEIGSIEFYIKYQELYTGSATSVQDDVANPRFAVLAAMQIGSNADMDTLLPEAAFNVLQPPSGWFDGDNEPFSLRDSTSFVVNSMGAGLIYEAFYSSSVVMVKVGRVPKVSLRITPSALSLGELITVTITLTNASKLWQDSVTTDVQSTQSYELDGFPIITGTLPTTGIIIQASSNLGGGNVSISIDSLYSTNPNWVLTKFDVLKLWTGYPFTFSFLIDVDNSSLIIKQYGIEENLLITQTEDYDIGLIRHLVEDIETDAVKLLASYGNYDLALAPSAWTNGGYVIFTPDPFGSKTATQFIKNNMVNDEFYGAYQEANYNNGATPLPFSITVTVTDLPPSGQLMVRVSLLNYLLDVEYSFTTITIVADGTTIHNIQLPVVSGGDSRFIAIAAGAVGSAGTVDVVIELDDIGEKIATYDSLDEHEILIKSPCINPIYLVWKNTLGGAGEWLFDWTQEYTHNYSDGKKCKRMVLYADGLSFSDFEAIDELNTPGNIVDVPIIELTTDLDKTSKKTDQQVYVVQPDGSKVGVVVITNPARTQTKRRQHFIEIEIEFPETFL